MQVVDLMFEGCYMNSIAASMSLDQSAAFDCIQFNILEQKHKMYKFYESTIEWVINYLKFRTNYVSVGAANSHMEYVNMGVPPGVSTGAPDIFYLHK